ncbi:non-ribosomal peptide synthetase/type I polyketide synthase [Stappia indica]|uniref:non-ribosomal peptide synthetase/type I polyketide synthase n=1 Tax=Stappia indica TaxID=538381 RepID=UPI001CD5C99A|nr:non-ribosomal peptide synthetase/type I polyketide synthase [Stappia indica]MCA1298760.1 amino acid adenylation domain-containing protein [Stappia indica]
MTETTGRDRSPQAGDALAETGAIAIVGMSGRFPDAPSVDDLWQMVRDGRHAFAPLTPEEIEDAFTDEERASPNYVAARPHLEGIEEFDAEFFGMFPREASFTDPQHRIFLEICWEALEGAGCDPRAYPGLIGVFAGASMPTYLLNNVLSDRAKLEEFTSNYQIGCFNQSMGGLPDALATRVAYKLDLRGPAVTMLSACSTSLVAVTQACRQLQAYGCDMALAGGVSITIPQRRGYIYQEGGMASSDGVCRPFDADASGTVFASGAGVVLLKRYDDAVADGDRIFAVIRGCGLNNDGADKIGFTAPSIQGQADAIAMALAEAEVDPASVAYVECHGTATPLGDPIEFNGLNEVFIDPDLPKGSCALGSLKSNIGHMDCAAGVSSLIKTALALHHATLPPMANYATPNPRIALDDSPFRILTQAEPWPDSGTPRRAGVSSFGVGGTNAHVVLEQAPSVSKPAIDEERSRPLILPLSARTPEALDAMRHRLAEHLRARPELPLSQVARTLQSGRRAFARRTAIVASSTEQAVERLSAARVEVTTAEDSPPPVVFMFPGQGAQYVGMAAALYACEPVFALWIDRGAELLKPSLGLDLRDYLCHTGPVPEAIAETQRETRIAQPCLYIVQHALAQLWISRKCHPDAMIGHSVGEFVAATLANVIGFEDGLALVAARGRLMQDLPQGAMVSVRAAADAIAPHLRDGVEIAAINAPTLNVISGTFEAVDATCAALEKAEIAFSRLHTSHAFHSAMMDGASEALRAETAKVTYGTATIPYISCVTGTWQTDEQGASPDYWARHCRDAVRFADGLATLCADRKPVLIEVGPGRTLSVFAAQTIARSDLAAIVQSLPEHDRATEAAETLAQAHGKLWAAGCTLPFPELPAGTGKTWLPTYPFQRQRHWIDAPASVRRAGDVATAVHAAPAPESAANTAAAPSTNTLPDQGVAFMSGIDTSAADRIPGLETTLLELLTDMSGEDLGPEDRTASFLELGFDSLFIGQFAQKLEKQFKVKLSFRELLSDIPSVADLAAHLDRELPPEVAQPAPAAAPAAAATMAPAQPAMASPSAPAPAASGSANGVEAVMHMQMQMMQAVFSQQLQALQGSAGQPAVAPQFAPAASTAPVAPAPAMAPILAADATPAPATTTAGDDTEIGADRIKIYRPGARPGVPELTPEKTRYIDGLISAYSARNAGSKAFTDANRPHLADPRTASGFRPDWKEMVFPVVSDRSKGSRIWDIDGNEYIDLVNGMGQTAFGHAPDFVVEAVKTQLDSGFAIGPQTPLAGEVAKLISQMVGMERVTFCNTGSEAVMAAMRLARAVTGRDKIVVFANDYHGQFDEVLVKGRNRLDKPVALPIAPGIPATSVGNMIVLKYGAPESLDWVRRNAGDLAAVIIEPVQSRHPDLRPVEFVRELRTLATEGDYALVFDEVVTGFRVHPGGMQAIWGIKGDMATYGKVIGGGMPIGILAGDSRYMDALDGGCWRYGDDSAPMTAPTFFAGTFVRHPVVLAACRAVLRHIEGEGAALYGRVAERTGRLVAEIEDDLAARGIPGVLPSFSSWFTPRFSDTDPLGALMFPELRMRGIHALDGYPCFLTTAHSEDDIQAIAAAFRDSADALQAVGILAPAGSAAAPGWRGTDAGSSPSLPASTPLTEAQQEVWLSAQAGDEASCAFNESFSLTLEGPLDEAAFRTALDTVIARHDALHIRFARDGSGFEFIPDFALELPLVDLSGKEDPEVARLDLVAREAHIPFDLTHGPLVRGALLRLAADRHVLLMTAHHIICDGWSINVIIEELAAVYSGLKSGEAAELPSALSYATYARDLAPGAHSGTRASDATEAFWLDQYRTVPPLPDMPLDRDHPERRSFAGGTRTGFIDKDRYKALKKAGGRSGATLFSTLLATLQVLVARLSGSDDIVIAVPSAGQSLVGDQTLVGHCVNLLPLRQTVAGDAAFVAHLKATQQVVLQAFEHQDYTYGTLVRKLGVERDPSRLPLTEIQFNLERIGGMTEFTGLRATIEPNGKAFSNFDMFFNMIESAEGIRIDVDYNADVLDPATVDRWIGHFATLASDIAANIETPIDDLALIRPAELQWLREDLNQSAQTYEEDAYVHALVSRQAAAHPGKPAVVHDGNALTYGELEARSNQLARHLRKVLPGQAARIALLLDRSPEMLIALLAVMKAGHTYVPLDPEHPEPRLTQTLEAARVACILCDGERSAALAGSETTVIRLDTDRPAIERQNRAALAAAETSAAAPAYIIFTSGSTGTPKGVEVSHRALTNFMQSMAREPGFAVSDILLAVTTVSFDIAALELYLPLIAGGTVVLADREQVQDGFALVDLTEACGATVIQATPTLWRMLVEAGMPARPGLKILCGGEPLPQDLAMTLFGLGSELWNMYGPTETTIWSSVKRIDDAQAPVTIGQPIANTRLYIVDHANRIAPIGVPGELLIGGDGLANGYFDRPDLTEKAFVQLDLGDGRHERLYRTGDVGKRLADGALLLQGRIDAQIKLRGFRIEPGEIEAVMASAPGVRHCAVVAARSPKGDTQLVGYVVPESPATPPSSADLATHARERLPAHMVPAFWTMVEALPQTGNGKLDRKALSKRGLPHSKVAVERTAPRTPLEEQIAKIWQEILTVPEIGVDDNIYSLGADSLSIFRIAARLLEAGLGLEAKHILRHPSIAELATFAQTHDLQGSNDADPPTPSLREFRGQRRRNTSLGAA